MVGSLLHAILIMKGISMNDDNPSEPVLPDEEKLEAAESICPKCGVGVRTHRCRLCGATKTINQVSGNVIWMCNGRVVPGGAFEDDRHAYVEMAKRYGIPRAEWPEKFRS